MTRTNRKPKDEPITNQGPKHVGVRRLDRPGRPNPYGVQWKERIFDGAAGKLIPKTKTLFFPTKAARDERYHEQLALRRSGMLTESATRDELTQFRAFLAATEGTPWQVVVAGWRENLVKSGRSVCRETVETAVDDYLARMKALRDHKNGAGDPEPKLSADNYRHKDHKLTLFKEQFGHLVLDQVPAREIAAWVDDFDEVQSDVTFDNYVKHVSALFGDAIKRKVIRENPCKEIERRHDGIGEVKIITPAQTAQLFVTAMSYEVEDQKLFMPALGRLALEAFVGLRFSSGCRIAKADINFEDRGITLPKKKLKTGKLKGGRRHYIDGLPDQIWDWLAIAPDETWLLTPRQYMELKSRLFRVAEVPHPHNCFRHGFATYDVAAHKNPGRTATILCHSNQEELWEHYNGMATQAAGFRYQSITPLTAREIAHGFERFVWPNAPEAAEARPPA
jgi:integrase